MRVYFTFFAVLAGLLSVSMGATGFPLHATFTALIAAGCAALREMSDKR